MVDSVRCSSPLVWDTYGTFVARACSRRQPNRIQQHVEERCGALGESMDLG